MARKNAAQWARFEQTKWSRPYLRVVSIINEATKPIYRERHNLVLSIDHPFWDTWTPPLGSICTLQTLSQRDIDRLIREGERLTFEPPL